MNDFFATSVEEFFDAIKLRDLEKVRLMLAGEPGLATTSEPSRGRRSPLHIAVEGRTPVHVELIRFLWANGADVNARDRNQVTPLHAALRAQNDTLHVVELLLELGADVNAQSERGNAPLDAALSLWKLRSHVKLIETLIRHGAIVNRQGGTGDNSWRLCRAAANGSAAVVDLMIKAGADVNVCDRWGSPLHYAVRERGNDKIVELLLAAGADTNARDHENQTPLDLTRRFLEVLAVLDQHAIANIESPIEEPVESEMSVDLAPSMLLLGGGGAPDTPLRKAARLGQRDVVEELINSGVPVDLPESSFKDRPLHLAARGGHAGVVHLLLERGAEVDARDCNRDTALHLTHDPETVRHLLAGGANPNDRNGLDRTAFQTAVCHGNPAVLELMIKAGANVNCRTAADAHTWCEAHEEWPIFVEPEAARPLYIAVCWGSQDVVDLLLNAGANINALSFGWTALHAAAAMPKLKMVQHLLLSGADVHRKSGNGLTPTEMLEGFRRSAELLRLRT